MHCCRLTVHEVLAKLEEDPEFWEADVYICPPDNRNVTDEDSADEEGGTVNNLSGKQLDAVAIATVKSHGEKVLVGDDNESQLDKDVEPENSPNFLGNLSTEPNKLTNTNKRNCKAVNHKPPKMPKLDATAVQSDENSDPPTVNKIQDCFTQPRVWKKRDFPPGNELGDWNGKIPRFLEEDWSPLGLFQLLFNEDIVQMICDYMLIICSPMLIKRGPIHSMLILMRFMPFLEFCCLLVMLSCQDERCTGSKLKM